MFRIITRSDAEKLAHQIWVFQVSGLQQASQTSKKLLLQQITNDELKQDFSLRSRCEELLNFCK